MHDNILHDEPIDDTVVAKPKTPWWDVDVRHPVACFAGGGSRGKSSSGYSGSSSSNSGGSHFAGQHWSTWLSIMNISGCFIVGVVL